MVAQLLLWKISPMGFLIGFKTSTAGNSDMFSLGEVLLDNPA